MKKVDAWYFVTTPNCEFYRIFDQGKLEFTNKMADAYLFDSAISAKPTRDFIRSMAGIEVKIIKVTAVKV